MNSSTLITVVLCLALLTLRYLLSPRSPRRLSKGHWLKTARVLVKAALALAAIGYTLQRHAATLGEPPGAGR